MIKAKVFLLAASLAAGLSFAPAAVAQNMDTSGNGLLKGAYYLRQTAFFVDTSGIIEEGYAISGNMTFDGAGNYSFSGNILDSNNSGSQSLNLTGVYSVQSNGIASIQSLIEGTTTNQVFLFGAVAQGVLTASSTESNDATSGALNDLLVAIPAGSTGSNSSFSGTFTVGSSEILASDGAAQDTWFNLTADGKGNIATFTMNGASEDQNNTEIAQSASGVTYSFAQGGGTINFPSNTILSGAKTLYVSADGNFILGGSTGGYDIFFGVKQNNSTGGNALFNGTYFTAGLEDSSTSTTDSYDAFAGSINSFGNGDGTGHERYNSSLTGVFDYTFDVPYSASSDGSINQTNYHFGFGLNGQAAVIVGQGSEYLLEIALHAPSYSGSGVYLNPIGIVNSANFAPITNSVAPGEDVTLFGTGLASATTSFTNVPLSTTLGGVQVLVNGTPAPLISVSPNQINAIVPYEIDPTTVFYATFQVVNNGVQSNPVTVFTNNSAPGIFSLTQNGIGSAAVLHPNYSVVSDSNPARTGETLQVFLTGLGDVTPGATDGAVGSANPLTAANTQVTAYINGVQANVTFAGLAPSLVGLYQVNVVVPSGLTTGDFYLDISTTEAYTSAVMIAVKP